MAGARSRGDRCSRAKKTRPRPVTSAYWTMCETTTSASAAWGCPPQRAKAVDERLEARLQPARHAAVEGPQGALEGHLDQRRLPQQDAQRQARAEEDRGG